MSDLPPAANRKVFIKTYGCQMNVYDSQRMNGVLEKAGYCQAAGPDDADLVILNTCHIREKAAEKVYSEIGRMRPIKQARSETGRQMLIAVAGCVAQAEGEEIINRARDVDLVFGPQTYHLLPDMIARIERDGGTLVETDFHANDKFDSLDSQAQDKPPLRAVSAFVTVQEGCDKFCSFCVVPFTRGVEFSRPVAQIEHEVAALAARGVREITLLGQNVNAYHGQDKSGKVCSLGRLLEKLARIEGIERLRFTTSHPRDMDDGLISAMAGNSKVMPYLHLPVQAGSDKVLKAMNRRHTASEYIDLIARIRQHRPEIALSGDFIVGFPGETDKDFDQTLELVREVTYAQAYSFKYSPRPGTKAAESGEQVPEEIKSERLQRLQALLNRQQKQFNEACLGQRLDILLEKPGRYEGQLTGRSPYLQAVHVEAGRHKIGEIVTVKVDSVGPNSLSGRIMES